MPSVSPHPMAKEVRGYLAKCPRHPVPHYDLSAAVLIFENGQLFSNAFAT